MPDLIPKKIHVVWLGSVFTDGRENIEHWMQKNPDYEVNLWVDSLLYADESDHERFEECKQWAEAHGIQIRDLNENARHIQEGMISESFYSDEILGKDRNLAAASEMVRVEALYLEGGVYFDAKDVYPGEEPIGDLQPQYGFLCRGKDGMDFDVDVLASLPYGEIITGYRENICRNYHKLYANPRSVEAHRNSSYRGPDVFFGGDSRRISLAQVSSTEVMCKTIEELELDFSDVEIAAALSFPYNTYVRPEESNASWLDVRQWSEGRSADWSKIKEILRHYVILSLKEEMSEYLQESSSKRENPTPFLMGIKKQIQAFPLSTSLQQLYDQCYTLETESASVSGLEQNKKERIFTEDIVSKIGKSAAFLEKYLFPHLEANYNAADVEAALHSRYSIVNTCLAEKLSVFFSFIFLRSDFADFLKLMNLEKRASAEYMSYALLRDYSRIENRLGLVSSRWRENVSARRELLKTRMQKDLQYVRRQLDPQLYNHCCENIAFDINFTRQMRAVYEASDDGQKRAVIPSLFLMFNLFEFWAHKLITLTGIHHKLLLDIDLGRDEFYQWLFKELPIQEDVFFDELFKPFRNLFPITGSAGIFSSALNTRFYEIKNWFDNSQNRFKSLLRVTLVTNKNLIVPCLRYLTQTEKIEEETRGVLLNYLWELINIKYGDHDEPALEFFFHTQYLIGKCSKLEAEQFILQSRGHYARSAEVTPPVYTIKLSADFRPLDERRAFERIKEVSLSSSAKTLNISFDIDTSYSKSGTINKVFFTLDRIVTELYQLKKQNKIGIEQVVFTGAHRREDLGLEPELHDSYIPAVLINAAYHFAHPKMFSFFRKFFWEDVNADRVTHPVGDQIKLICQVVHVALNAQDLTSEQLEGCPTLLRLAHAATELMQLPRIAQQLEKGNVYDIFFELTKKLQLSIYPQRGLEFITQIDGLKDFVFELTQQVTYSEELSKKLTKPIFDIFSDEKSTALHQMSR